MAVGTVSALEPNQFQLISSQSATSGTTITFSNLSGYKTYLITFENLSFSTAPQLRVRFNSDSTSGKYIGNIIGGSFEYTTNTGIYAFIDISTTNNSAYLYVYNALESSPKRAEGANMTGLTYGAFLEGMWFDTSAITSISCVSTQTYSSGTIKLYGIAG
jgi:hypothetical protein